MLYILQISSNLVRSIYDHRVPQGLCGLANSTNLILEVLNVFYITYQFKCNLLFFNINGAYIKFIFNDRTVIKYPL